MAARCVQYCIQSHAHPDKNLKVVGAYNTGKERTDSQRIVVSTPGCQLFQDKVFHFQRLTLSRTRRLMLSSLLFQAQVAERGPG